MYQKPLEPLKPSTSKYGIGMDHPLRGKDLPDIGSVLIKELFVSEFGRTIFPGEQGVLAVRKDVEASLENVDMSMIKAGDSVNILASHHSFTLMGGEPYAEFIRTVRDVVHKRTGAEDIRLLVGVGLRFREAEEYIKKFGLDDYFKGKAWGVAPIDRGIAIDTCIGTLYGIKKVYDADWIIHTHHTDIREVHLHRMVDRIMKPFGMSYARIETRSVYHQNLGPRSSNFVARAIFESKMVKSKHAFSMILKAFPGGITGVDSDNDLLALNDRSTIESLRKYGKVLILLGKIPHCIAILDCPSPIPYAFGGGVIFANFFNATVDQFDLDIPIVPEAAYQTRMAYGIDGRKLYEVPAINPAIKMVINLYSFKGFPSTFLAEHMPTIVVGKKMVDLYKNCPVLGNYMSHVVTADSLGTAIDFAYRVTGTRNVIIYDGAKEGINASTSLIKFLLENAPKVNEEVEKELMPKWLRQRGLKIELAG